MQCDVLNPLKQHSAVELSTRLPAAQTAESERKKSTSPKSSSRLDPLPAPACKPKKAKRALKTKKPVLRPPSLSERPDTKNHRKTLASESPKDAQPLSPNNSILAACCLFFQVMCVFIIAACFAGVLFFLTVSVIRPEVADNATSRISSSPLSEIIFYIFLMGSITDFAIRTSGVATSQFPRHVRCYKLSGVMIVFVVCSMTILMSSNASIYQMKLPNTTRPIPNGNCSTPHDIAEDFKIYCPQIYSNDTGFRGFVHVSSYYDRVNFTEGAVSELERSRKFFSLLKKMQNMAKQIPFLAGNLHRK
jgi:hypothetical protein